MISKSHVHKFLEVNSLQNTIYGRLSRRRYSCAWRARAWVRNLIDTASESVVGTVRLDSAAVGRHGNAGERARGLDLAEQLSVRQIDHRDRAVFFIPSVRTVSSQVERFSGLTDCVADRDGRGARRPAKSVPANSEA